MIDNIENFRRVKAKSVVNDNEKEIYLLRGGPLDKIDHHDISVLKDKYNLKTIIDFRSKEEVESAKNITISGVEYFNLDILDPKKSISKNPMEFLKQYELDHDLSFMEILYTEFVLNDYSKANYRDFLEVVAKSKGSVYFHCTAGKDRTGFAAMLLLEILGASHEDIFLDYLKTNSMTKLDYKYNLKDLRTYYDYEIDDDLLKDLIGVKKEYLDKSLNLIHKDYSSVLDFITTGLGVSELTLETIRSKYKV
ncbi:MAG: tyrosine-protein phosphatase [Erysipelothrix sp.]|nr:tyrosine-protein phosphatase [Erysipelothrix sp.]